MKKIYFIFLFSLSAYCISAQVPSWQWIKTAGGVLDDNATGVCTDRTGNVYVAGFFKDDTLRIGSYSLVRGNVRDIFLAKYNSAGTVLWAKSIAGGFTTVGWGGPTVTTDSVGNVFIGGNFSTSTLNFGAVTLTNLSTPGNLNMYVAKYSSSGTFLWAKSYNCQTPQNGSCIAADNSGNVYVAGSFWNVSTLSLDTITLNKIGGYDSFIAKFNSAGAIIKTTHLYSDSGVVDISCIGTDKTNNILVCGGFIGHYFQVGSTTLSTDFTNPYIAKFDSQVNAIWGKKATNTSTSTVSYIHGVRADNNNNIAITGNASGVLTIGSVSVTYPVNQSGFLLGKLDANGNGLWLKSTLKAGGSGVAFDNAGNVYVTGDFTDTTSFDTCTVISASTVSTAGDVFVVKYSPTGTALWAKRAGGWTMDHAAAIEVENGNIYVTGFVASSDAMFDLTPAYAMGCPAFTIYLAKINSVVGIEENTISHFIKIYPNPSSGTFKIKDAPQNSHLEIYNMLGEKIYSEIVKDENLQLHAAAGIYFVRVSDGAKSYTQKLMIQ
jgi:hypothetical protein